MHTINNCNFMDWDNTPRIGKSFFDASINDEKYLNINGIF